MVTDNEVRSAVRRLLRGGVYHQSEIFEHLYPDYLGHYARLRQIISEEKNYA